MNIKCRICLASSDAKMYHSLFSAFPTFLKTTFSVCNILQKVTHSNILIFPGWPYQICTACLKRLKECHGFIEEFHKAQAILERKVEKDINPKLNSVFIKTEEEIVLKVEPPDDTSDPLLLFGENEVASPSQSPSKSPSKLKQNRNGADLKKSISKTKNTKKGKTSNGNVLKTNKTVPLDDQNKIEIDVRTLDHNYTKDPNYQLQDYELDSEESMSDDNLEKSKNLGEIETIKIVNTKNKSLSPLKGGDSMIVLMSVDDVRKIKRRPSKTQSLVLKSRVVKQKRLTASKQPRLESLRKVLAAKRLQNQRIQWIEAGQTLKCNMCSKAFSTSHGLNVHNYVHTPEYMEKLKCTDCGHQSNTKSAFFHHKRKHLGKLFKCDECDKTLSSNWNLTYHKRIVHGEGIPAKFMCNECGKTFKYGNALKYHIVSTHHKEDKEYLCGFCGFKCVTKTYLKRHERCHTNERPYKCKFCPRMFGGTAELQSHHLAHEQKSRYRCKHCGKGFITTWNMKVHWLQHYGSYKCDLCSKSFLDHDILRFHYRFKHKLMDVKHSHVEDNDDESSFKEAEIIE